MHPLSSENIATVVTLVLILASDGSIVGACGKAHVGRGACCRRKARFDAAGYPGLEKCDAKGPKKGYGRTSATVEKNAIEMHAEQSDLGKYRLAHEIAEGTPGGRWPVPKQCSAS